MKRNLKEAGLTLVEIIVVLIILGIVMAFVSSKIFGAGDKAKQDLTKMKLKEIKMSVDQFRLRYNSLPRDLNDLRTCNDVTGPDCSPILSSPDMLKDAWGNDIVYISENSGRAFTIKSFGADGREGGAEVNFDVFEKGP